MEKTWENFWKTGRVTDYQTYRNSAAENVKGVQDQGQGKQRDNGTVRDCDGNGFNSHAC